jgi:hypothetical protein
LAISGSEPANENVMVSSCEIYDPVSETWSFDADMNEARWGSTVVMLPTGELLAVGGGNSNLPARPAMSSVELYHPDTGWKLVAPTKARMDRHSVIVLLADGRVLAISENSGGEAEVYQPPYLFRGKRPKILTDVDDISGSSLELEVRTDSRTRLPQRVVLLGTVAMTHWAIGGHSRYLTPSFTLVRSARTKHTIDINLSGYSSAQLPPGYYILFVLTENGAGELVPSEGRVVRR